MTNAEEKRVAWMIAEAIEKAGRQQYAITKRLIDEGKGKEKGGEGK
jgi:hypothetical protein